MAARTGVYGRFATAKHGRYKNKIPCRCTKCGRRSSLNHLPSWYSDGSKIPYCCGKLLIRDHYRACGAEAKGTKCNCSGYPFSNSPCVSEWQHRRGSLFCHNGGKATQAGFAWGDKDLPEYQAWVQAGMPPRDPALVPDRPTAPQQEPFSGEALDQLMGFD